MMVENATSLNSNSVISRVLGNPVAVAQLVFMLVFLVTSVSLLCLFMAGASDEHVRFGFPILGLCVISFGVSVNRGTAAVTLAVLIVGVLVAPSDYLLRIAHMIARPRTPFGDYEKKYEGSGMAPVSPEEFVSRVLSGLEKKGVADNPSVQNVISRVVTGEALRGLVDRMVANGVDAPLRWVVEGPAVIRERAAIYSDAPEFQSDMVFLRREGLVSFEGEQYGSAIPTDLGRRVLEASGTINGVSPFELDRPAPDEMNSLGLGEKVQRTFEKGSVADWLRVDIPTVGTYRIDVTSQEGDPEIRFYGPNSFTVIATDDDGGPGMLDARIEREVFPGTYYIGVRNLHNTADVYEVVISQAAE